MNVFGGAEVSQGTSITCTGYLTIPYATTSLSGELYLSNGEVLSLNISVNAMTNLMMGAGWG
ncbi:hypothetical protein [Vulcanisaeta sp. JCM 16161]|uniref:hypothetical protein n=1 Tax=Vulcanisaeta sp. JCM 16161 TaxID=1295372 RepID=UPI000AFC5C9C|nr:hypothetical protein [Vulcanisaeta sp. JCM 16161]